MCGDFRKAEQRERVGSGQMVPDESRASREEMRIRETQKSQSQEEMKIRETKKKLQS